MSQEQIIKPMLAKSNPFGDKVFDLDGYVLQEKIDGMRIIAIKEHGGEIALMSRSWKDNYASRFPEVVKELKEICVDNFIIDGELAFYHKDGKCEFFTGRITRDTIKENELSIRYNIFDVLEMNYISVRWMAYKDRFQMFSPYIHDFKYLSTPITYEGKSQFKTIYETIIGRGGEGVVLKKQDSSYKEGGRTNDWIKVKRYETGDFFICGITEGTGRRKDTFGALILGQYTDDGLVNTVKCGTGFDMKMERELLSEITSLPRVDAYFSVKGLKPFYIIEPKLVCECKYMEVTKKSVRHPVFLHLRTDKTPEQCIR